MNKKAFTLIELMAIIIILAIIGIIVVPIVQGRINEAEISAYETSRDQIKSKVSEYVISESVNKPTIIGDTVEISIEDMISDGYVDNFTSDEKDCTGFVGLTKTDPNIYAYTPEVSCYVTATNSASLNLLGHWTFDGHTYDSTSNNNHGIDNSNYTFTRGHDGSAASAIRITDGTDYPILSYPITLASDFTISYWVKPGRDQTWRLINNSTAYNNAFGYWDLNRISMHGPSVDVSLSKDYEVDKWFHDIVVKKDNEIYFYRDGELIGQNDWDGTIIITQFGGNPANSGWWDFEGDVDDIRVYNRAIEKGEVRYLTADID